MNFAIADRRLDDALGYLNRIPADSPRRGQSDLYAGQALWAAYLKAAQAPADERPPQEELDRFKSQARQVLHDGVERIKQGAEPSAAIAAAMLSLAQIYLDMNERPTGDRHAGRSEVRPVDARPSQQSAGQPARLCHRDLQGRGAGLRRPAASRQGENGHGCPG